VSRRSASGDFDSTGLAEIPGFLPQSECAAHLAAIARYRASHEPVLVHRDHSDRPLHYEVIDGDAIHASLPDLGALYRRVGDHLRAISALDLVPLASRQVGLNVNITPPGGSYRWHYDRNAVTALVYLNEVDGGETEICPRYRVLVRGSRLGRLQASLDRVLRIAPVINRWGGKLAVVPHTGTLLAMRGDRCLHSVRPVTGSQDRVNVVMSFDTPEAVFPQARGLDNYLYTSKAAGDSDPNYRGPT
jgi:hypothetical protein